MTDKLEQDVAEILEAFEEYKERTGTAPEKVQELKHGTTIHLSTFSLSPFYLEAGCCHGRVGVGLGSGLVFGLRV